MTKKFHLVTFFLGIKNYRTFNISVAAPSQDKPIGYKKTICNS